MRITLATHQWSHLLMAAFAMLLLSAAGAEIREEHFDHEPAGWEGVNNHSTHFPLRTVTQDFGYSPSSQHAGGAPGEVGGKISPAGEAAFYSPTIRAAATAAD